MDRGLQAGLARGPVFLLFGQGHLRVPLAELEGLGVAGFATELEPHSYKGTRETLDRFSVYMSGLEPGPELKTVANFPWNGVFTSRVDDIARTLFTADWRRVVGVAGPSPQARSRNKTDLQVRHLFGAANLPEEDQPPTDDLTMELTWQARAEDVLNDLASNLITPRGVLLVSDWDLRDWITPKELAQLATKLLPGQLHLFSVNDEIADDRLIAAVARKGLAVLHRESLGDVLQGLSDAGVLPDVEDATRTSRLIPAGEGFATIPTDVWNEVIGSARPVDLALLEPFPASSDALLYQHFRSFLGATGSEPPWRGLASGFRLRREFESSLSAAVQAALVQSGSGPVVLQGQTATGKTLALAGLAQDLAASGQVAVLHQARRRERPGLDEIEAYSEWADTACGMKTVLIWDAMVDLDDYVALQRQFLARGDRVLVVGSSYRPPHTPRRTPRSRRSMEIVVEAPVDLTDAEATRIAPWLAGFGVEGAAIPAGDSSILALLYRTLPETRGSIAKGLSEEMRRAVVGLQEAARREDAKADGGPRAHVTAVAQALMDAGLVLDTLTPADRPHEDLAELGFHERSVGERLSAVVLTVGRYGLSIPLALALRTLGHESLAILLDYLKRYDIFRWTEDANGEPYLTARTTLEAEIGARHDLSDRAEADVIMSLIRSVNATSANWGGNDEVQFLVDLMHKVGPQGESPHERWYGDFAAALADARETSQAWNHRLVLVESNLLREYAKGNQQGGLTHAERMALFREVEALLDSSLNEGDQGGYLPRRSRMMLWVEYASCLGAQVYELTHTEEAASEQIPGLLKRISACVREARLADPENYYPVDVLVWATITAVDDAAVLDDQQRLAMIAEVAASLDSVDGQELSGDQYARFLNRGKQVARLRNDAVEAEALDAALRDLQTPAAFYLVGSDMRNEGRLEEAFTYMRSAPVDVLSDWKCAGLLFRLGWESITGKRLMQGESETIGLARPGWEQLLEVVEMCEGMAEFEQYRRAYVRGLALFHLGLVSEAKREFADLGAQSIEVRRRMTAFYLAADAEGVPIVYTGRVAWATPDGRSGRLWVNELREEIPFLPARLSQTRYRSKNEVPPSFNIGFNLRGPRAEFHRGATSQRPHPGVKPPTPNSIHPRARR